MKEKIWETICMVRKTSTLVHNITNYVVMNTTANALLAIGASPVMAHAEEEVEEMVKIASALVINMGTLSEHWVKSMKLALKKANEMKKPVVFDPVGAGATPYRNKVVAELLKTGSFDVVRGNASEIMSMVSAAQTKGVDSTASSHNAFDAAKIFNEKYKSVVCISGETDYVIDGKKMAKIHNGDVMMTKVTGLGCTATALIGAFIGSEKDYFLATASAMCLMGVTGELAAKISKGPGSLQLNFIDKLYNITKEEFLSAVKIEMENV
jgi:hydroxyethylthiazole kinase